jgi:hypothetical protein
VWWVANVRKSVTIDWTLRQSGPHSIVAMQTVARTVYDKPEQYRKLMLQAAQFNLVRYYDLGDYEINRQEEDMGVNYIDMACASDPDSVRVSSHAYWRVPLSVITVAVIS